MLRQYSYDFYSTKFFFFLINEIPFNTKKRTNVVRDMRINQKKKKKINTKIEHDYLVVNIRTPWPDIFLRKRTNLLKKFINTTQVSLHRKKRKRKALEQNLEENLSLTHVVLPSIM